VIDMLCWGHLTQLKITSDRHVMLGSPNSVENSFVFVHQKMSKLYIVTFEDKNKYSVRRAIWKTYTTL